MNGGWLDDAIAGLHGAVDVLDGPTLSVSDARLRRLVVELGELTARVESRRLAAVAELDARPGAVPGAAAGRAGVTFLIHGARSGRARAFADVAAAALIDPDTGALRLLGAAFAVGEVSRAHVDAAVRVMTRIPKRLLRAVDTDGVSGAQKVDAFLAEHCRRFGPDDVKVLIRHLLAVLDPGGGDRFDEHAFERRELSTHPDATGMLIGTFQLDPEGGATVRAALDHHSAPRPLRWAVTQDGTVVEVRDVRSKTQRDADALVTICRKALADGDADPEQAGRMPAHVTVTATVEQLAAVAAAAPAGLAHCDQLGPVQPAVLARLACDGVLHRVLTARSGAVLDVGRTVRCATPTQRKALAVRDNGCLIPGCGVPVALCDIHHVQSWAHGGPTDLVNLTPLCPRHHSAVHAGVWTIHINAGLPWVVPPSWVDPQRRPLRNGIPAATQAALTLAQQITNASQPATEPADTEPADTEPADTEPADAESADAESASSKSAAADQARAAEPCAADPDRPDPTPAEPDPVDPGERRPATPRPTPGTPPDRQSGLPAQRPRSTPHPDFSSPTEPDEPDPP